MRRDLVRKTDCSSEITSEQNESGLHGQSLGANAWRADCSLHCIGKSERGFLHFAARSLRCSHAGVCIPVLQPKILNPLSVVCNYPDLMRVSALLAAC